MAIDRKQLAADAARLRQHPKLPGGAINGLDYWLAEDGKRIHTNPDPEVENFKQSIEPLLANLFAPAERKVRKEQEPPPNLELEPGFDFQVAYAPTVKQASKNRNFTIKTLAAFINEAKPVTKEVADALIEKHGPVQGALEIKKTGGALYFGRYPDGARVRTMQNLEACTAIILDFDGRAGDRVHRDDYLAACREHKIAAVLWDTYSSTDDGFTFRAALPCNELAIDCYASAAMALKQLLGIGPKTILPASQAYFFTARPGNKPNVEVVEGRSVDQVLDFNSLEAIADGVAPAGQGQSGNYDLLDAMDNAFDDARKELYLACLKGIEPWSENRNHWIGVIGAGLRGWGLTPQKLADLKTLTEAEKEIITRLDSWSKDEHPPAGAAKKYSPNCVVIEWRKLFSVAAPKKLGLAGVVKKAHESSAEGIGEFLEDKPALLGMAERILEGKPAVAAASPSNPTWGAPTPLTTSLLPAAPFDYDLLPAMVRDAVRDISERMGVPPDYVAASVMVGLGTCIGTKVAVYPKAFDNWHTFANLWCLLVGRPGTKKSPAMAEGLRPLTRLEVAAKAQHQMANEEASFEAKVQALRLKKLNKEFEELVARGDEDSMARAREIHEEMGEGVEQTHPRRYLVTDATPEKLGVIMSQNPQGVMVTRDELSSLLASFNKKGNEEARGLYLTAYDGDKFYRFERMTREDAYIAQACLSICGGIQEGKLRALIKTSISGGDGDDGTIQRFGMLIWPDRQYVEIVDRSPDVIALNKLNTVFFELDAIPIELDLDAGRVASKKIRFSAEAQPIFNEWFSNFEANLGKGDTHEALESHLSKYRKLMPSIALICALADREAEISPESTRRALGWIDYLRTHAERAYDAGSRPQSDSAAALLKHIQDGDVKNGFRARDVYRNQWSMLNTKELTVAAITMLCDYGHLDEVINVAGRGTGIFMIHPNYLEEGRK